MSDGEKEKIENLNVLSDKSLANTSILNKNQWSLLTGLSFKIDQTIIDKNYFDF